MALSNSKALIGHIRISLKCQQSQAALLQSKKKNQEVSVENPFDRSLLYFKELTSASEKLPTSSGLSPPPCKKVFLSSGDNCYLFCWSSLSSIYVNRAGRRHDRDRALWSEWRQNAMSEGWRSGWGVGGGPRGASCQEIWHQGQGWRLELTQPTDGDDKRPEDVWSLLKLPLPAFLMCS